jgi:hypothetical protein
MRGIIVPLRSRTFMDSVRGALGISPPGRSVLAEIVDGVPRRYAPMPKPRIARSQLGMADGIHYRDSKQPFPVGPQAAVTLLTTDKLLWPGSLTALVANYLWAGKAVALTAFGTLTTGATPGNLNIELYYGTTDAGGTLLASSAALTLVANQTTIPWVLTAFLRCRGVGAAGTLFAWGQLEIGTAVVAAGQAIIPASAPAAVTGDTTVAGGFNAQMKRSGSTAESAVVQDMVFEALN